MNNYSIRLLNICKENNLYIVNGHKEPGQRTFHSSFRNRPVSSTVDYVTANDACYDLISQVCTVKSVLPTTFYKQPPVYATTLNSSQELLNVNLT